MKAYIRRGMLAGKPIPNKISQELFWDAVFPEEALDWFLETYGGEPKREDGMLILELVSRQSAQEIVSNWEQSKFG